MDDSAQNDVYQRAHEAIRMIQPALTFSTAQAPPRRRLEVWNELLSQRVLEFDVKSDGALAFDGAIVEAPLGTERAFRISVRHNQRARHCHPNLLKGTEEDFCLIQLRQGGYDLAAGTRAANLTIGDSVLVTTGEQFRFECPEVTSCLVLRFRSTWLRRGMPNIGDFVGHRLDSQAGWGRALAAALWNIEPQQIADWSFPATDVADQIAGLLSLAVARNTVEVTTPQRALLKRARGLLAENFHEPDLRPATIAAELGISKRYLHQLFATAHSAFSRELFTLRLAQARRLLENHHYAKLTITEIGVACGFCDASHFSRLFSAEFGISPRDFRQRVN